MHHLKTLLEAFSALLEGLRSGRIPYGSHQWSAEVPNWVSRLVGNRL